MRHWTARLACGAALAAYALALGAARAPAQTITGTVRSAGRPVVGASVRLLELDRVERTGAEGAFPRIFVGVLSVIKDFLPQPGRGFRLNYLLFF